MKGHVCHFKPAEFPYFTCLRWGPTTLGRPQWGQQNSAVGHLEPQPSCQKVSGLPGRALRGRTNHCYGAVRCWENARGDVRVESYNFPVPGDFSKTWWYADALSFEMFWRWSNSLGYYLWEAVGAYGSPDRVGYGRMILPLKKAIEAHLASFEKVRFDQCAVAKLMHRLDKAHLACASTHGHLWRRCLCLNLLEGWISPQRLLGYWGPGWCRASSTHDSRFWNPHSRTLSPCLTRCWDHVVCAQTQRHYSDYTHYRDGDPTYPLTTLVGIGVGQQTGQGIQLAWKSCHQSTSE